MSSIVPEKFQPFVNCLRIFAKVKHACFGTVLQPDWNVHIDEFEKAYRPLDVIDKTGTTKKISVTPKGSFHKLRLCFYGLFLPCKVEKILKGSLDSIPSPSHSVKIQITVNYVVRNKRVGGLKPKI